MNQLKVRNVDVIKNAILRSKTIVHQYDSEKLPISEFPTEKSNKKGKQIRLNNKRFSTRVDKKKMFNTSIHDQPLRLLNYSFALATPRSCHPYLSMISHDQVPFYFQIQSVGSDLFLRISPKMADQDGG